MKNTLQKVRKNKKGFTLVELIVCLVIMAVLAAIAIPTMLGYVNKAKDTADTYECRTVLMAAQTICSQKAASNADFADDHAVGETTRNEIAALAEVDQDNLKSVTVADKTIGTKVEDGEVVGIVFKASSGNYWTYAKSTDSASWTNNGTADPTAE